VKRIPIADESKKMGVAAFSIRLPFHTRDRSPVLELDSDGQIKVIGVERGDLLGAHTDGPGHESA
jgi:hypothetical protein